MLHTFQNRAFAVRLGLLVVVLAGCIAVSAQRSKAVPKLFGSRGGCQAVEAQGDGTQSQSDASMRNLKQVGLALLWYTQDYDKKFPPMVGATRQQVEAPGFYETRGVGPFVQQVLWLYLPQRPQAPVIRDVSLFVQPATHVPYQPNGYLSGMVSSEITSPERMVAFYEAAPDAQGKRAVLFVDGHVERINESAWPALRQRSSVTVRLAGAAALYYFYQRRQTAPAMIGPRGRLFQSENNRRIYYRYPDGRFQYVGPPTTPVELSYLAAQPYLGYQGYNISGPGRGFGGYGAERLTVHDAEPVTP